MVGVIAEDQSVVKSQCLVIVQAWDFSVCIESGVIDAFVECYWRVEPNNGHILLIRITSNNYLPLIEHKYWVIVKIGGVHHGFFKTVRKLAANIKNGKLKPIKLD